MTTAFKSNPGINPAALPEWRKITAAINDLERHRTIVTGKLAGQSRTLGNAIASTGLALAGITTDTRVGNAPTALAATATGYYDGVSGNPYTKVALTWTAPTAYTDGSTYTASGYEIWRALSGGEWQFVTRVTGTAATVLRQPFAGAAYQFEVRAQSADNGDYGPFTAPITVTPPTTLAALPAPSTPALLTSLGTVRATWDGLLGGATPPAGFRGVYAVVSTDGGTTWAQKGGNLLFAGAQSVISGYANGTALQVRFRAIDALSGISADSATASITVVGVTGPDITANSITTNQIASGQITTTLLAATAIDGMTVTGATVQTSATASRGIKLTASTLTGYNSTGTATFVLDGSTGAITANGLNATSATISGAITATSGSISGTMLVSGTLATGTTGARVQMTSAGIAGFNAGGTQTFSFLTANGVLSADSATLTNASVSGTITAAAGSVTGTLTISGTGQIFTGSTVTGDVQTSFSTAGVAYKVNGGTWATLGQVVDTDDTVVGIAYRAVANSAYAVMGLGLADHMMRIRGAGGIMIAGNDGHYTSPTDQMNFSTGGGGVTLKAETGDLSLSSRNVTYNSGGTVTLTSMGDITLSYDTSGGIVKSSAIYARTNAGASGTPGTGASHGFVIIDPSGILKTLSGSVWLPAVYSDVISTRAVMVSSNGHLGTTASSKRVKKNLKPLNWDEPTVEKWLDLKPYEFEYKGEAAKNNPGIHHGFIAEDAHDAGFTKMVYYDGRDGDTKGQVDGFAYERMGVYDHIALGHLYHELMSLRQRVAVLEGSR